MVACLIYPIMWSYDMTSIGFSLDYRSDCIMGEWRHRFCAYVMLNWGCSACLLSIYNQGDETILIRCHLKTWLVTTNSFVIFNISLLSLEQIRKDTVSSAVHTIDLQRVKGSY